jgi:uncharacterized repeat protein (TIGR03803 family)
MVFRLSPQGSSWTLTQLYAFEGDGDGQFPQAGIIIGSDHSLYGTTVQGGATGCDDNCGTVFSLAGSPNEELIETQLHRFTGGHDGYFPGTGDLAVDNAGNLYGTTSGGGSHNQGTVYELRKSGGAWTERIIHNFEKAEGGEPFGGVVFDRAGNLFGTTTVGSLLGFGTVYELSPSGSKWIEKTLYTFHDVTDGSFPEAGLIMDRLGNLYGATPSGGSGLSGTIFELTPGSDGSWAFHLLYSLAGELGGGPIRKLAMDSAGNLYGTTTGDGVHFDGSVFKLTRVGSSDWQFESLHDFSGGSDGNLVYGGVALDKDGNVFGTTGQGGSNGCSGNGCGVIFKIVPGHVETHASHATEFPLWSRVER